MVTEDVDTTDIVVALKGLLQHPGWTLFEAQIDREWGPAGYGRMMQHAIASVPQGPDRAYELAQVAERVEATAQAVAAIRKWPQEQIQRLSERPRGRFDALRRGTR